MRYGRTQTGYMWHILKNDGESLCNKQLKVKYSTDLDPRSGIHQAICNSCEAKAQLCKNKRLLYPENMDGDGI